MGLTKAQLEALNDSSFPNNNAGAITPAILRNYNDEVILNTVNQDVYSTDSASFDSRIDGISIDSSSLVTTASFNQYTASNDTKVNNLNTISASYLTFTQSYYVDSASFNSRIDNVIAGTGFVGTASFNAYTASTNSEISAIESFTASVSTSVGLLQTFSGSQYKGDSASFDSRIDSLEAFSQSSDSRYVRNSQTSSMAVSSSTYAVTASYALNAQTASESRNLIVIARNGNQSTLSAGTVVHITGASGDNPIFNTASYDTELLSANTLGILRSTSTSGADVEVVVNGIVTGVNTDPVLGYVAGDVVYLGANGTFTKTQPQAPNQIVVLGQVLRAQQNNGSLYVSINNGWELDELHNVQITNPQTNNLLAYESSSYGLWKNKSIGTLGLATTGSNTFVGNQIVSGNLNIAGNITAVSASFISVTSSVVLGGNTILLNTFTPAVRYGGIEVVDSGSTGLTGSLLWDSQNDVWLYVNPSGSTYVSAKFISGPKSLTLGSEPSLTQNRVPKADDGDHIVDSQISDDGTTVTITNAISASTFVGLGNLTEYSASVNSRLVGITIDTSSFATTGSNTFVGNQTINGAVQISSSATYDLDITGGFQATAASRVSGSNGIVTFQQTNVTVASGSGVNLLNSISNRGFISVNSGSSNQIALYSGISPIVGFTAAKAGGGIAVSSGSAGNYYFPIEFQATTAYTDGRVTLNTPISASAGITSSNAFINGELYSVTSASFDSRIIAAENVGYLTTASFNAYTQSTNDFTASITASFNTLSGSYVATSQSFNDLSSSFLIVSSSTLTFATTGSNNFIGNQRITGSVIMSSSAATELQVIGAIEITGSVAGNVTALSVASNTASIDFNLGSVFTLTIPSSTITYITGSNLKPGQTANIILTQQVTTGSVRFESTLFKFPSGSINTGSAIASAVDMVSVASVSSTTLYAVTANRLI
jgi:hypothetical protein